MRAVLLSLMVASLTFVGAQTPSPQRPGQVAPAAAPNPAKPTGVIRGHVLLPNGRPARRASIRMLPESGTGAALRVLADLEGRYEFTGVPPGSYRLTAGKPGYLSLEYGQQRAFEQGKALSVKAGETLERIDIRLPASGAVSGRIVDEYGGAVEAVAVRLMQVQFGANRRRLLQVQGIGPSTTDDTGSYRLFGVPPGQYVVLASVTDSIGPGVMPANLPGYAPTYYPGTANPGSAQFVNVALSQHVSAIDFALAAVPTVMISGVVRDSIGQPFRGGIGLSRSQRSGGLVAAPVAASSNADGSFRIPNVPPGDYVLQVIGPRAVNEGTEGEFASQFVTVNGTEISGLQIQTSVGSTVSGRVTFEGNQPRLTPASVTITSIPTDFDLGPLVGPAARASTRDDGTFEMRGISGPRRLLLMRAPTGWTLKAIRMNGTDVTDTPLPFGTKQQSLSDLEVVLTDRISTISGTVGDARGQPLTDYTVIVFSINPERWYQQSRFLQFARSRADGTFFVAELPPAEYYVAAVDAMRGTPGFGEWQDPEFLESIASRAARVTLSEGQQLTVTPRLIVR